MAQAAFAAKCVVHPQVFAQQSRPETKSRNASSACLSRFVTILSYSAKRESRVACHLNDNSSNKPSRRMEGRRHRDHGQDRIYSTLRPIPSLQPSVPPRDKTSRSKPPIGSYQGTPSGVPLSTLLRNRFSGCLCDQARLSIV